MLNSDENILEMASRLQQEGLLIEARPLSLSKNPDLAVVVAATIAKPIFHPTRVRKFEERVDFGRAGQHTEQWTVDDGLSCFVLSLDSFLENLLEGLAGLNFSRVRLHLSDYFPSNFKAIFAFLSSGHPMNITLCCSEADYPNLVAMASLVRRDYRSNLRSVPIAQLEQLALTLLNYDTYEHFPERQSRASKVLQSVDDVSKCRAIVKAHQGFFKNRTFQFGRESGYPPKNGEETVKAGLIKLYSGCRTRAWQVVVEETDFTKLHNDPE